MTRIEEIENYLGEAQVFYMATVGEDGSPKCRPLGLHILADDKIFFGVGTFKDVYRQMQAEPRVEICACKGKEFMRYYGKAVFETDETLANQVLAAAPSLQKIYNEQTGYKRIRSGGGRLEA